MNDGSPKTTASKNDQKKPDLSLIPQVFLNEVARAFMVGEVKYGRYNYCKGHKVSQLVAAMLRHITAYNDGQEYDPVDGQHHLGAAGACAAMILRQKELGTLDDNRFQAPEVAEALTVDQQDTRTFVPQVSIVKEARGKYCWCPNPAGFSVQYSRNKGNTICPDCCGIR